MQCYICVKKPGKQAILMTFIFGLKIDLIEFGPPYVKFFSGTPSWLDEKSIVLHLCPETRQASDDKGRNDIVPICCWWNVFIVSLQYANQSQPSSLKSDFWYHTPSPGHTMFDFLWLWRLLFDFRHPPLNSYQKSLNLCIFQNCDITMDFLEEFSDVFNSYRCIFFKITDALFRNA